MKKILVALIMAVSLTGCNKQILEEFGGSEVIVEGSIR